MFGGQPVAQALRAAGLTVPEGRLPHSLHGYFLRAGDAGQPTDFRVDRDRDGGSYSARRVTALQRDEVIFTMSCSFTTTADGPDVDDVPAPDVPGPENPVPMGRIVSMETALPPYPYPGSAWPTRYWVRCTADLPDDPLLHACVLAYVSDVSNGTAAYHDETARSGSSLDHALWFHRPVRMDEWVLMDLVPHTIAHGRGFYSGTMRSADGALVASIAQESLFRSRRKT
ncbi:acyl-CoA thioesterase II [Cryptosporangium phraense]|uniref:Acyl-CoA thioesterase II n=2 Tax=Cryptosporangium phraense TaxID=2593070 RepID=A0A545AN96_9ACTN|nr:acyl-CoA thioesterase II [Cryptosporangium phraense]